MHAVVILAILTLVLGGWCALFAAAEPTVTPDIPAPPPGPAIVPDNGSASY